MTQRTVLITAFVTAGVLALAVLLVLKPWGSNDAQGDWDSSELADRFPSPVDPGTGQPVAGLAARPGWASRPLLIRRLDEERIIEIRGQRMQPLENNEFFFEQPLILFRRGENEILAIHAHEGWIEAPDNQQPVQARLVGRPQDPVLMTWYEIQPVSEQRAVLEPRIQAELVDANIDLELGQVVSSEPVRMITPAGSFTGVGINLTINTLHNRIERLVIQEGREMRLRAREMVPGSSRPAESPPDQAASSSTSGDSQAQRPTPTANDRPEPAEARSTVDAPPADADRAPPPPASSAQWYHARFLDDVRIVSPTMLAENADRLELLFTDIMRSRSDSSSKPPAGDTATAPAGGTPTPPATQVATPPASPATRPTGEPAPAAPAPAPTPGSEHDAAEPAPDPRTRAISRLIEAPTAQAMTFSPQPDDVIVTWSGRMLVDPVDWRPREATDDSDVVAHLQPVDITLTDEVGRLRRVNASNLTYSNNLSLLGLTGDRNRPLRMFDPLVGLIESDPRSPDSRATIAMDGSSANWAGAGMLQTEQRLTEQDLPGELRIRWNQSAEFGPAPTTPRQTESPDQRAVFRGDVRVRHVDFSLDAGQLLIDFPQQATGAGELREILATENAKLVTRDSPLQPGITLQGGSISMKPARWLPASSQDGRNQPTELNVRVLENGEALLTGASLHAGQIDIRLEQFAGDQPVADGTLGTLPELADPAERPRAFDPLRAFDEPWEERTTLFEPAPPTEDDQAATPRGTTWKLQQLTAGEQAELRLEESQTRLAGHRIDIDQTQPFGRVDLRGQPDGPHAQITQRDSQLTGRHIRLVDGEDRIAVDGPGTIRLVQRAPASLPSQEDGAPAAAPAPADSDNPVEPSNESVTIHEASWERFMSFNDPSGELDLGGNVRYRSTAPDRVYLMTGDQLKVRLEPRADSRTTPRQPVPADQDTPLAATGSAVELSNRSIIEADGRNVLRLEATMDEGSEETARFLHERYEQHADDHQGADHGEPNDPTLLRRFQLRGPQITLDRVTDLLEIPGQGSMLYQDFAAPAPESSADAREGDHAANAGRNPAPAPAGTELRISGSGDTLWTWQGDLRADFAANNLRLRRNVVMTHRPLGSDEVMHLFAHVVYADFAAPKEEGEEGTQAAASPTDGGPMPELVIVRAEGSDGGARVRLSWPARDIWADQMIYNAILRRVELSSAPTRWVQVVPRDDPTMLTARRVLWEVDRDRIELFEPGPTTIGPRIRRPDNR